jgi:magnesium transporter
MRWTYFRRSSPEATRPDQTVTLSEAPQALPTDGFLWLDSTHDDHQHWIPIVEALTGNHIDEFHKLDLDNLLHPNYFDSGPHYAFLVARGLMPKSLFDDNDQLHIATRPAYFLVFDQLLVTRRNNGSRSFEQMFKALENGHIKQIPPSPNHLMLKINSWMIDKFLDARQPIADKVDRWQHDLLDMRRPFRDWPALLAARTEIHRLELLVEGQREALRQWIDHQREEQQLSEDIRVQAHDAIEHIERVLKHAERLGQSTETAVQLHFSATAHRTSEIMRVLTILSAVFMPLTLITGIFGMNFDAIPGLHSSTGFWWTLVAMIGASASVLILVWRTGQSNMHRRKAVGANKVTNK